MSNLSTLPKLPKLRGPATKPTGPAFLPRTREDISGPGLPPNGFVTGKNSATEWNGYWALAKIFRNPRDPRQGPFLGGWPDWAYQSQQGTLFGLSTSTNVDFLVYQGGGILAIRVQTERYHIFTSATKHAYDELQRIALESRRPIRVVDIYEPDLLHDPSGQKYVITMKKALGRLQSIDPILAGTALRGSRMKVLR